ncbi:hypothetical protein LCGC14_3145270 [marine sediment metagenome]|uniref:Uncharacterized protein n=1 Tax=marine sediment metagenome TaxID=412755 RepID=A0A0F8Y2N2_9ZZZZ
MIDLRKYVIGGIAEKKLVIEEGVIEKERDEICCVLAIPVSEWEKLKSET